MDETLKVLFIGQSTTESLKYVVIAARYEDKWVFVRHRERETYEIPGGHIESGEDAATAAGRELYEETGALEYDLHPISRYRVTRKDAASEGFLFFADIRQIGELPAEYEIGERLLFDKLPERLTYPQIQPFLQRRVEEWLRDGV